MIGLNAIIIFLNSILITSHAMETKGPKAVAHVKEMMNNWKIKEEKYQDALKKLHEHNQTLKKENAVLGEENKDLKKINEELQSYRNLFAKKPVLNAQEMQEKWNSEKLKYQEVIRTLHAQNTALQQRLVLKEQSYVETVETLRVENHSLKTHIENLGAYGTSKEKEGKRKKGILVTQKKEVLPSDEKERKSLPVSLGVQRKLFSEQD